MKSLNEKLQTAFGNGAGVSLTPPEVVLLVAERNGSKPGRNVDAARPRDMAAIAFGDGRMGK